jgi:hypothetical protein
MNHRNATITMPVTQANQRAPAKRRAANRRTACTSAKNMHASEL